MLIEDNINYSLIFFIKFFINIFGVFFYRSAGASNPLKTHHIFSKLAYIHRSSFNTSQIPKA
jgi:hypothetical protein